MDVEISGKKYSIAKLDAVTQFHVWRRLMPVFLEFHTSARAAFGSMKLEDIVPASDQPEEVQKATAALEDAVNGGMLKALAPSARLLSGMSDPELNTVLNYCLAVCRRGEATGWAPIIATTGGRPLTDAPQLMYQDLGVKELMFLSVAVIKDSLGNFFDALPTFT